MIFPATESLRLSEFDYDLPESLIAQQPSPVRDKSRLMVLNRAAGSIEHRVFSDIERYLVPGDLLVLNNTRVIPCRLPARKKGGGKAEIFLVSERGVNVWDALVKGGVTTGKRADVGPGIEAEVLAENSDGTRMVRFHGVSDIREVLREVGKTPL